MGGDEVPYLKTMQDFKDALKNNERVALDFTATWCPPCKMIGPKFVPYAIYSVICKSKLDLVESISTLKSELTKAAIASGTNGNKVRENAVKAAAFAKEMVAKEATMKELEGFEKKLEDEYKALQM